MVSALTRGTGGPLVQLEGNIMLEGIVGDIIGCMDDENTMPVFPPENVPALTPIMEKFLSPDQRKGYIYFPDEILQLAADAELVRKYRYPDDLYGFIEEMIWVVSQAQGPDDEPLWGKGLKQRLSDWFKEELDNSAQFKFDFRFDFP